MMQKQMIEIIAKLMLVVMTVIIIMFYKKSED